MESDCGIRLDFNDYSSLLGFGNGRQAPTSRHEYEDEEDEELDISSAHSNLGLLRDQCVMIYEYLGPRVDDALNVEEEEDVVPAVPDNALLEWAEKEARELGLLGK